jgi:replicative DNA helicase
MAAGREAARTTEQVRTLLPHDKEAEQGVLGTVLHNNNALLQAAEIVQPDSFFSPAHRELFRAMLELHERREPIDEITLAAFLRARNQLEPVGGIVYIAELGDMTPLAANVTAYAEIVREKHQLRSLITAAMDIATKGRESGEDVQGLIQQAEDIFLDLANKATIKSYSSLGDLLKANLALLEKAQDLGEGLTGLATGFRELDDLTNGLQRSDLIIVAARPGMGKTSFALNIAEFASVRTRLPVAVFSLEMSKEQMAYRLLCAEAKVDSQKVRRGELDDYEWDKLAAATAKLSETPIFIDDTAEATPLAVKAIARRIQAEHGLGLVVVDYLQLMRGAGRKDNREQEIAEISRGLKALAKELDVPVIACAQLNRALEARANKRPMLADLRESGAIEQDADIVMFIYRDEIYNPKTEDAGVAEIAIAKHRNGPITHSPIRLAFVAQYTKFAELTLRPDDAVAS